MNDRVRIFNINTNTKQVINSIDFQPKLMELQKAISSENFDYEFTFKGNVEELCNVD